MKSKLKLPLILLLTFWFPNSLKAQTVMGSEIEYRGIDSFTFEIELSVFIDCRDTNPLKLDSTNFFLEDQWGTFKYGLNPKQKSIRFNGSTHDSVLDCRPNSKYPGIQEVKYFDTLDFRLKRLVHLQNKTVRLAFQTKYMSGSTNIDCGFSTKRSSYNYTEFNSAHWGHRFHFLSETTNMLYQINTPTIATFNANPNTGKDSIVYSLTEPLRSRINKCNYIISRTGCFTKLPFTAYYGSSSKCNLQNPFTFPPVGIYFDPENANLIYTPTDSNERANFVVQATRWRKDSTGKYVRIAILRKELFHITRPFARNRNPQIKGPYAYSACEESLICITVSSRDIPHSAPGFPTLPKDTVSLRVEGHLDGLQYEVVNSKALHQSLKVCWTPKIGRASTLPYHFTVHATDSFGPIQGVASLSFSIRAKPKTKVTNTVEKLSCGQHSYGYLVKTQTEPDFQGNANYQKTLLDSSGLVITWSKKAYFHQTNSFFSTRATDTLILDTIGVFIVKSVTNNPPYNCPLIEYDTIDNTSKLGLISFTDSTYCDLVSDTLWVDTSWDSVVWNDTSTHYFLPIDTAGYYSAKVQDTCGNTFLIGFTIRNKRSVKISGNTGQKICDTIATIRTHVSGDIDSMRWSSGLANTDSLIVRKKGYYTLKAYGHCNIDSHTVHMHDTLPSPGVPDSAIYCISRPDTLKHQLEENWQIRWSNSKNSSTNDHFPINPSGGLHYFKASNECGDEIKQTIKPIAIKPPKVGLDTLYQLCSNDSLLLNMVVEFGDRFLWSDGDTNFLNRFHKTGTYWAKKINLCGSDSNSFQIKPLDDPIMRIDQDSIHCEGDSVYIVPSGNFQGNWTWSTGQKSDSILVTQSKKVIVRNQNKCGVARDSINLIFEPVPVLSLDDSFYICPGAKLEVKIPQQNTVNYYLNNTPFNGDSSLGQPGFYRVRAENNCRSVNDSFVVLEDYLPSVQFDDSVHICKGDSFKIQPPHPFRISYWLNNSLQTKDSNLVVHLKDSGFYKLKAANQCGRDSSTFYLNWHEKLHIDLGADQLVTLPVQLELKSNVKADEYEWNTGAKTANITVTDTGMYWLEARNKCGIDRDTVYIKSNVNIREITTSDMQIYPNPVGNILTIRSNQGQALAYKLYNTRGQLVRYSSESKSEHSVHTQNLKAGIYTLLIRNERGSYYFKISKPN